MKRLTLIFTAIAIATSLAITSCSQPSEQPEEGTPSPEETAPSPAE
jgi:hypothetical protein